MNAGDVVETLPYDRIMLWLHDAGKLDNVYQRCRLQPDVSFPAGTTWMCFTDPGPACSAGRALHLEQTFHLPLAAMAHPERAPLRVRERMTGRSLA